MGGQRAASMTWTGFSPSPTLSAGGETAVEERAAGEDVDNVEFVRDELLAGKDGSRNLFQGKRLREITLRSAMDLAIERNLNINIARQNLSAADAARTENDAAYDPLFSFSWSYQKTKVLQRDAYIQRLRSTKDDEDEAEIVGCVTVDGQVVNPESNSNCFTAPAVSNEREFATTPTGTSAIPNSWTATAGLTQILEWGSEATVSISSVHRKKNTYTVDLLDSVISDRDPFSFGSRMPWTSSASLAFATPLPMTKSFGENGSQRNLDIFLAYSGERKARAERASTRNSVLESVAKAFWDLVESLEELKANIAHRKTLEEMYIRTKRLFEQRRVTAYEMDQVEAELGNIKNVEEISWDSYLARSNAVLELLDQDLDHILIPVGVDGILRRNVEMRYTDADRVALENNPDIKISMEDMSSSRKTVKFRENQTKPDVSLNLSYQFSQSDTTFGYRKWIDSVEHIFTPDSSAFAAVLRLTIPLGKRAEFAAARSARIAEKQASDNVRNTRNNVVQRVSTAVNILLSTQELIKQTQVDLDLARLAYDKAREQHDLGLVTKFELLTKFDDLRVSRLANNSAKINLRRVRAELMAAQGLLDARYAYR